MRAAEGRQYTAQEGAGLEIQLTELKAEKSVVTLQVN